MQAGPEGQRFCSCRVLLSKVSQAPTQALSAVSVSLLKHHTDAVLDEPVYGLLVKSPCTRSMLLKRNHMLALERNVMSRCCLALKPKTLGQELGKKTNTCKPQHDIPVRTQRLFDLLLGCRSHRLQLLVATKRVVHTRSTATKSWPEVYGCLQSDGGRSGSYVTKAVFCS